MKSLSARPHCTNMLQVVLFFGLPPPELGREELVKGEAVVAAPPCGMAGSHYLRAGR